MGIHRSIKVAFFALILALCSANAGIVVWDLNPNNANGPVGGPSHTFTSSGFSITAYAFDRVSGTDPAHDLWFKDQGNVHGLGITGTPHNELQDGTMGPQQYIQFDLASILSLNFTDGQIEISGVGSHEEFDLYGSNTLGHLGTKISLLGGPYDETDNNMFVNIPDFGNYRFISVVATKGDVLPWALSAKLPAIPELGGAGAALVLLAFVSLVLATRKIGAKSHN